MEKYSGFRDAATGLQPFLNPVPPQTSDALPRVVLPIGYLIGAVRTVLVLLVTLLYILLVKGTCMIFLPVPPLYRFVSGVLTSLLTRLALFIIGFYWIPVTVTSRKRGRAGKDASSESWAPLSGDLIVSNWVSWVEILWLAFRFNPTFVIPIAERPVSNPAPGSTFSPSRKTGRQTGTGSANISMSTPVSAAVRTRAPIRGFKQISLLRMIGLTGRLPPFDEDATGARSLDDIRRSAGRPVVVFPECTTSNGRALLQFADVFGSEVKVPIKGYSIYVICVRYDPPTPLSPSLALSIPSASSILNPTAHLFQISTNLIPQSISIRLLPPSESPSAATFAVSDIVSVTTMALADNKILKESCEALVAGLGKLKRTQLSWEDKGALIEMMK
ncbi:uncharacterized protein EI90DRAFT_2965978 [Cantharellus anzutake]|uniref:uncharacterized protein n=1 Tax=Cantharellus anzutake TaxID=1750568 RepID=UPI001903A14D|nr:uncharacterized protein EI90DRAFT_2965978 [Cantharellus anzutake]KAF8341635.1 hypothetical protein EI90DRAFT_2965978 [Cantharellus anzutake]